jgi:hypothetical protein
MMYTEALMQAVAERRYLPLPWQEASTTSDWHLHLTPERAEQLTDALAELIDTWSEQEDAEDTEGAADFVVNLNAFPRPGTVVLDEDAR